MQRFEGQVQLVLYPFALNPTSEVATQAAWCAGEQGKFWEFHHMLYRRQELWNRLAAPLERLSEFAKDLNLDTAALMGIVLAAGIPIEDCGCFGNLGLPETPLQVLMRDLLMLVLLLPIIYRQRDALGLDAWSSVAASQEG